MRVIQQFRGDSVEFDISAQDDTGAALNLAGKIITLTIGSQSPTSGALAPAWIKIATIIDAPTGKAAVQLVTGETAAFRGNYMYAITVTLADGSGWSKTLEAAIINFVDLP